ncbi:MAG: ATP-dependent Clp protease proteolytic subunit [Candidatus Thorarchaeota archaeon]|jgi:ATP-dependent Clp protease protease subunit
MAVRSMQESLLEYGVIQNARTIVLAREIGETSLNHLLLGISALDKENADIYIKLATEGGDMYTGLAMYDALRSCKSRVVITGYGYIFSAGTVILQAGDERLLTPNSTLLLHAGYSSQGEDIVKNVVASAKETDRISRRFGSILAEAMGIEIEEYMDKYTVDSFFDAKTAVEKGLADKVLST